MRIALVTTCRGRVMHLRETLPRNLEDCGSEAFIVLLDYNDQDGLADYIQQEHQDELASGKLVYYRQNDASCFHMANAKNMAHRCAMLEGADILVTLDADNFTGAGFVHGIKSQFQANPNLSFLCPNFSALPPPGHRFNHNNPLRLGRGFAGRLAIRTQDFIKVGGYNEVFDTWRGEDIDLIARLNRMGFEKAAIPAVYLNAIAHSSEIRFREYPEARKHENDAIYEITENSHDTVVNYGNFGCGTVYRNFDDTPIFIDPMPTRIFGIGMQRTGTTSLHKTFQQFGYHSGHWKSAKWAQAIWWEMKRWGHSQTLEQDYALTDNPIPILYEQLDKAYPGSKFVLTVRDEKSWIESMRKFWTYDGNPQRWCWDEDGFSHKMHGIIYGMPEFNEQIFLERYRKHNAEALAYFSSRPDDLLLLDLDDNSQQKMNALCRFLGKPATNQSFPHLNRGPHA